MDYSILIPTILGSAGLFAFLQYLINRHDRRHNQHNETMQALAAMRKVQDETNLRVTRMELLNIIDKQPDNIDAILQVAESYFIELNGNAYAHALFEKWANEHNIAIGWLPKLRKGVVDKKEEIESSDRSK